MQTTKLFPDNERLTNYFNEVRFRLQNRGAKGTRDVLVACRMADPEHSGILTRDQFEAACNFAGVFLNADEVSAFISSFGTDEEINRIYYERFYCELVQPLTEVRENSVKRAWAMLSKGRETVPVQELINNFHPECHPLVLTGQLEKDDVLQTFVDAMIPLSETKASQIDYELFNEYYRDISNSITSDAIFKEMISETWGLHDASTQKDCDRVAYLEEALIEKIRQHCKPKDNNEKELMKICRFYDSGETKTLSRSDFENVLRNYGMLLPENDIELFFNHYVDYETGEIPYRDHPENFIPKLYKRWDCETIPATTFVHNFDKNSSICNIKLTVILTAYIAKSPTQLTKSQYLLLVVTICLSDLPYVSIAFALFATGSNSWPIHNIGNFGEDVEANPDVLNTINTYDENHDGSLTQKEFYLFFKNNSFLFQKLTIFLDNIKKMTLGIKQWNRIRYRYHHFPEILEYQLNNGMKNPNSSFFHRFFRCIMCCQEDPLKYDYPPFDQREIQNYHYNALLKNILNNSRNIRSPNDSNYYHKNSNNITNTLTSPISSRLARNSNFSNMSLPSVRLNNIRRHKESVTRSNNNTDNSKRPVKDLNVIGPSLDQRMKCKPTQILPVDANIPTSPRAQLISRHNSPEDDSDDEKG